MAEKTANYTEEQAKQLGELFTAGKNVDELATKFGKSTRSIIAKLSRMGLYKAKERTTKNGTVIEHKEVLIAKICKAANFSVDQAGGLDKANKQCLINILAALNAKGV